MHNHHFMLHVAVIKSSTTYYAVNNWWVASGFQGRVEYQSVTWWSNAHFGQLHKAWAKIALLTDCVLARMELFWAVLLLDSVEHGLGLDTYALHGGGGGIHLQRLHEVGSKPVTSRWLGWCRRGRASMLKAMDAQFAHQRFQSLNNRNKWCLFYGMAQVSDSGCPEVMIWKYRGIIWRP